MGQFEFLLPQKGWAALAEQRAKLSVCVCVYCPWGRERRVCQNNNATWASVRLTLVPSWDSTTASEMAAPIKRPSNERRFKNSTGSESTRISKVVKSGGDAMAICFSPQHLQAYFFPIPLHPSPVSPSLLLFSDSLLPGLWTSSNQIKPESCPLKSLYFRAKKKKGSVYHSLPMQCQSIVHHYRINIYS